jgi:hypothetical protein
MTGTIKIPHLCSPTRSNSYYGLKNNTFHSDLRNFLTSAPKILLKQNSGDIFLADSNGSVTEEGVGESSLVYLQTGHLSENAGRKNLWGILWGLKEQDRDI